MQSTRVLAILLVLTTSLLLPGRVEAASPHIIVVSYGDTLATIATRHGTTVEALVRANSLPNARFVWAGQRLIIPSSNSAPYAPILMGKLYIVNYGDTLQSIAARLGTTGQEILRANNLYSSRFILPGQRLKIPSRSTAAARQPAAAPPNLSLNPGLAPTTGKWIDVDISAQTIIAYLGNTPLKSNLVSTGMTWFRTPLGEFKVYRKVEKKGMSGGWGAGRYYLPNVPWIMYFSGTIAIHGAYWHNDFGTPVSHGCVNLPVEDAKWFFQWAEVGTPVMVHP